jgi:hypothetical protein
MMPWAFIRAWRQHCTSCSHVQWVEVTEQLRAPCSPLGKDYIDLSVDHRSWAEICSVSPQSQYAILIPCVSMYRSIVFMSALINGRKDNDATCRREDLWVTKSSQRIIHSCHECEHHFACKQKYDLEVECHSLHFFLYQVKFTLQHYIYIYAIKGLQRI